MLVRKISRSWKDWIVEASWICCVICDLDTTWCHHRSWRKGWRKSLWWPRPDFFYDNRFDCTLQQQNAHTHTYTHWKHTHTHFRRHDSCKCKCAQQCELCFKYIDTLMLILFLFKDTWAGSCNAAGTRWRSGFTNQGPADQYVELCLDLYEI